MYQVLDQRVIYAEGFIFVNSLISISYIKNELCVTYLGFKKMNVYNYKIQPIEDRL